MKTLEDKTQGRLDGVTLYLTLSETNGLIDSWKSIIKGSDHEHVSNQDYSREITASLYED